jgi:hypothetical protein
MWSTGHGHNDQKIRATPWEYHQGSWCPGDPPPKDDTTANRIGSGQMNTELCVGRLAGGKNLKRLSANMEEDEAEI